MESSLKVSFAGLSKRVFPDGKSALEYNFSVSLGNVEEWESCVQLITKKTMKDLLDMFEALKWGPPVVETQAQVVWNVVEAVATFGTLGQWGSTDHDRVDERTAMGYAELWRTSMERNLQCIDGPHFEHLLRLADPPAEDLETAHEFLQLGEKAFREIVVQGYGVLGEALHNAGATSSVVRAASKPDASIAIVDLVCREQTASGQEICKWLGISDRPACVTHLFQTHVAGTACYQKYGSDAHVIHISRPSLLGMGEDMALESFTACYLNALVEFEKTECRILRLMPMGREAPYANGMPGLTAKAVHGAWTRWWIHSSTESKRRFGSKHIEVCIYDLKQVPGYRQAFAKVVPACVRIERHKFATGFAFCSQCKNMCRNRGCGSTKLVVCSNCWPPYLEVNQVARYAVGDRVEVWSSKGKWVLGTVRENIWNDCSLNGIDLKAGALLVDYDWPVLWKAVRFSDIRENARKPLNDEATLLGVDPMLLAELKQMLLKSLKKRALAMNCSQELLDAAEGTNDPNETIIHQTLPEKGEMDERFVGTYINHEGERIDVIRKGSHAVAQTHGKCGFFEVYVEVHEGRIFRILGTDITVTTVLETAASTISVIHWDNRQAWSKQATTRVADPKLPAELQEMTLRDLKKEAGELGVSQEKLDDADGHEIPKEAVIQLILAAQGEKVDLAKPERMTLAELKAKARHLGVDQHALDDADDEESPEEAVNQLITKKANSQDIYVVVCDSLPVNATQARSSPEVAKLSKGTRVQVLEVADNPTEGRVRARIANPAGWITSKMDDDSKIFIEVQEAPWLKAGEEARLQEELTLKAEEEMRLKVAEEARLRAEEEERRFQAEEEVRLKDAEQARLQEEAKLQAEEEKRQKVAEEARWRAEEERRVQADSPETYVVICDSLPVNEAQSRSSPEVAKLSKGATVRLLEVADEPTDGRVRARIAHPAGWITSKLADGSRKFIEASTSEVEQEKEYVMVDDPKQATHCVVVYKELPVSDGKARTSKEIGKILEGQKIKVIEIAEGSEDGRVRARIEDPGGWITSMMANQSFYFVHKEPTRERGRAAPPGKLWFVDPRAKQASGIYDIPQLCYIRGFYFPDVPETVDKICRSEFLGNFHAVDGGLTLTARCSTETFLNAEAAFQALKFWNQASNFKDLSGTDAFEEKKRLEESGWDQTYGGYGSNFKGMRATLDQKFQRPGMRSKLLDTGDNFLLEHNSHHGRDTTWSNNSDGSGKNLLGLQLMLVRDDIVGCANEADSWTSFIKQHINLETGTAYRGDDNPWQCAVRESTKVVVDAIQKWNTVNAIAICITPGCNKPTYNGKPGERCRRSCGR